MTKNRPVLWALEQVNILQRWPSCSHLPRPLGGVTSPNRGPRTGSSRKQQSGHRLGFSSVDKLSQEWHHWFPPWATKTCSPGITEVPPTKILSDLMGWGKSGYIAQTAHRERHKAGERQWGQREWTRGACMELPGEGDRTGSKAVSKVWVERTRRHQGQWCKVTRCWS